LDVEFTLQVSGHACCLRQALGLLPVMVRKTREKWKGSENPTSKAMPRDREESIFAMLPPSWYALQ